MDGLRRTILNGIHLKRMYNETGFLMVRMSLGTFFQHHQDLLIAYFFKSIIERGIKTNDHQCYYWKCIRICSTQNYKIILWCWCQCCALQAWWKFLVDSLSKSTYSYLQGWQIPFCGTKTDAKDFNELQQQITGKITRNRMELIGVRQVF